MTAIKRITFGISVLALIIMPTFALSHTGVLDYKCGHYNKKSHRYHYHKTWKSCREKKPSTTPPNRISSVRQGIVQRVRDGDTVVIKPTDEGHFYTCRLYGIDAPEFPKRYFTGQPYGREAAKALKRLIGGKTVTVTLKSNMAYGHEICVIYRDKLNINVEMIKLGYAWAYKRYLEKPYASTYLEAEEEAFRARSGLWSQANPMSPWDWRQRQ